MFLVLLRALSLLYTPCVLLGSFAVFVINACFFIHKKKKKEIPLTPTLILNSVLHVPKLSCNLFSVSKFTQTNNCVAKIFPSYCEF